MSLEYQSVLCIGKLKSIILDSIKIAAVVTVVSVATVVITTHLTKVKYYKIDNSSKLTNFVENKKNGTTDINKLSRILSIFT